VLKVKANAHFTYTIALSNPAGGPVTRDGEFSTP
jgi:hypothetical protein